MKKVTLKKSQVIDLKKGYYGESVCEAPKQSPEDQAREQFFNDVSYMLSDLMRMKKTLVMLAKKAQGDNGKNTVKKTFVHINKATKILQGVMDASIDAEFNKDESKES